MPMRPVEDWVESLNLLPHPEGGFYAESYRSPINVPADALPENFEHSRAMATSIYFLLRSQDISRFHVLEADELWYYHYGSGVTVHAIDQEGNYHQFKLGTEEGQHLQVLIPGGWIFGSTVDAPNTYGLVGCVVAPGFDFRDFKLFETEELLLQFPQHEEIIRRLT